MKTFILQALVVGLVTGMSCAHGAENASNPLAAVNNTDLRAQYFDFGGPELTDYFIDGAYMLLPELKFKYDLHYWDTDFNGTDVSDFESLHLKPIYFPVKGGWGSWKYSVALGLEWIIGLADEEITARIRGTQYSDQLAPLAGVSFAKGRTVLVPLVQQFFSYSGEDINTTAFRLIAIQSFPQGLWGKLDAIVPVEWENDNAVPANAEVQLGKMFSSSFGAYLDGLFGIGGDKPYDWGAGIGVRFNY